MDIQAVVDNFNFISLTGYSRRPVTLNTNTVAARDILYNVTIIFGMNIVLSIFRSNCNVGVIFYGNPIAFFIISSIEINFITARRRQCYSTTITSAFCTNCTNAASRRF